MPKTMLSTPATNQQFGRYRLVERLGEGGMGVVYRAVADGPEGFSRSVVIKRIRPELACDPAFRRMLVNEARLCALLNHPSIVQVQELGQHGNEYFLTMEYVDGVDLATVLRVKTRRSEQIDLAAVCYLVCELASALAYAHDLTDEQGRPLSVIHRDVSPMNVMVTKLGAVKLLDFGIAKASDSIRDERTRTGAIKGKIGYLSPEQVDAREIDRRSDIFALGIVAYESLTQRRLFRGETDFHTMRMLREARVPPPSSLRAGVDAELDAVVLKMLARSPEDRFQTCDEVLHALQPIMHRLRGDATALRRCVSDVTAPRLLSGVETLGTLPPVPEMPATSIVPPPLPGTEQKAPEMSEHLEVSASALVRRRWWRARPVPVAAALSIAILMVVVVHQMTKPRQDGKRAGQFQSPAPPVALKAPATVPSAQPAASVAVVAPAPPSPLVNARGPMLPTKRANRDPAKATKISKTASASHPQLQTDEGVKDPWAR